MAQSPVRDGITGARVADELRHAILRHRTTKCVPVKSVRDALLARADQAVAGGPVRKT